MNEKEIAEIRRRYRPDKNNITHVRGCYVNEKKEIISEFNQSLNMTPEEEAENLLSVMKRTLSGTVGKNLIDIVFDTKQVVDSEEHKLLMELRSSSLGNEEAVQGFFQRAIQSIDIEDNYLILLAHDRYDVPYRSGDGAKQDDASSEVFSYILCSVCPIKNTKPELGYYLYDNAFHNRKADTLVSPPSLGFMFPAFDDRSANIYNALYYSRDIAENHKKFVDAVFNSAIPMPAAAQKELFQSLLEDTLAEDCSYGVVQAVQEQLCEMIETHKVNKEESPLVVSKRIVKNMLQNSGVSESCVTAFEERYDTEFGAETQISPGNLVDTKKVEVCTPDVTIHVKPECSGLVETRVIDGTKYILIRADEGVELNGVSVRIQ